MYTAFFVRTQKSIDSIKRHIATSEAMRLAIYEGTLSCKEQHPCFNQPLFSINAAPHRLEWRLIDHCAAVTRIYAIYEQFAREMIREHLSLLQNNSPFLNLPNTLRNSYRRGLAEILEKKDGPRYGHLNLENLISQYNDALSGKSYTLEPLALLIQEQNLRITELNRMFSACGIENISSWIEGHRSIKKFFEDGGRLAASADHEMSELVKYRNDASHGSIDIDEIPGLDHLYEFCDFISSVCEAISERVQMSGLEHLLSCGAARNSGKVAECMKSNLVLIGKMTGSFSSGDTIYLYGEDYCMAREITSLQIDNVDHKEVSFSEPKEIGIGIDKPGRKKANIITINFSAIKKNQNGKHENGELISE